MHGFSEFESQFPSATEKLDKVTAMVLLLTYADELRIDALTESAEQLLEDIVNISQAAEL